MEEKESKINRRNFLRTVGAAGLGSVLASANAIAEANEPNTVKKKQESKYPQVPKRKLGKTGAEVSVLSLGAMFDVLGNQIILRKSLDWGVNYWDTAHSYAGGNSELGIGKFLSKNPKVRKKLFIVSKASGAKTAADLENRLQTSLERMKE